MDDLPFFNASICSNCKNVSDTSDEYLVVDGDSSQLFCSETCIESFYKNLIIFYKNKFKEKGISTNEDNHEQLSEYLQNTISNPDSVFEHRNSFSPTFYIALKMIEENIYSIVIFFMFNEKPSFILLNEVISDDQFINSLSALKQVDFRFESDSVDSLKELEIYIEQKKSQELSVLLTKQIGSDIQIDQHYLYEKYLDRTLEEPDEVYEYKDEIGDKLYIYSKAFNINSLCFFYIAIVHFLKSDTAVDKDVVIPILSFPTIDSSLYKFYQSGVRLSGTLKN